MKQLNRSAQYTTFRSKSERLYERVYQSEQSNKLNKTMISCRIYMTEKNISRTPTYFV